MRLRGSEGRQTCRDRASLAGKLSDALIRRPIAQAKCGFGVGGFDRVPQKEQVGPGKPEYRIAHQNNRMTNSALLELAVNLKTNCARLNWRPYCIYYGSSEEVVK